MMALLYQSERGCEGALMKKKISIALLILLITICAGCSSKGNLSRATINGEA
jgi:hypothetical protein